MTAANVSQLPVNESKPPKQKKKVSASAAARQAEAEDGYVTVEQCGVTLRIPVRGKIPVTVTDMFRDDDNYGGTKALIGAEQWKSLSDAGMTMDDLDELGQKLQDAWGN